MQRMAIKIDRLIQEWQVSQPDGSTVTFRGRLATRGRDHRNAMPRECRYVIEQIDHKRNHVMSEWFGYGGRTQAMQQAIERMDAAGWFTQPMLFDQGSIERPKHKKGAY